VHAGFAATLLDFAVACSVQSTLSKGETYTTLELKLNLVRALQRERIPCAPKVASFTADAPLQPPKASFAIARANSAPMRRQLA
jgi:hypothetical protein